MIDAAAACMHVLAFIPGHPSLFCSIAVISENALSRTACSVHCNYCVLSASSLVFLLLQSALMAFVITYPFLLLLLLPLALTSKCSSPASASYADLINAGALPPITACPPTPYSFSPGNTAFAKQSYAVAEACYSRACALDPKQPLALSNRALAVMNQGRNQEALKVVTLHCSSHSFKRLFCICSQSSEIVRTQFFRSALKLDGKSSETYHALGSLLHNMGNAIHHVDR